jgi:hypothetical protein
VSVHADSNEASDRRSVRVAIARFRHGSARSSRPGFVGLPKYVPEPCAIAPVRQRARCARSSRSGPRAMAAGVQSQGALARGRPMSIDDLQRIEDRLRGLERRMGELETETYRQPSPPSSPPLTFGGLIPGESVALLVRASGQPIRDARGAGGRRRRRRVRSERVRFDPMPPPERRLAGARRDVRSHGRAGGRLALVFGFVVAVAGRLAGREIARL